MSIIKSFAKGLFGAPGVARDASRAQQGGFNRGIDVQNNQFSQILELLGPSIEGGDLARQQQLALLGLLGPEAQQEAQNQFQESPGQKFIRDRQERALVRNQSAIGGLGGGNIRTALNEQQAGFALQDQQNQFNRLSSVSSAGQNAATNIGQFGQNSANSISDLLAQSGNAQATGIFGAQQGRSANAQQAIQLGTALFSDSKLKENIKKIGKIGVLNVYEWKWKTTGLDDVGFIAEEVKNHFPDLVEEHNGYLRVDYEIAIQRVA